MYGNSAIVMESDPTSYTLSTGGNAGQNYPPLTLLSASGISHRNSNNPMPPLLKTVINKKVLLMLSHSGSVLVVFTFIFSFQLTQDYIHFRCAT